MSKLTISTFIVLMNLFLFNISNANTDTDKDTESDSFITKKNIISRLDVLNKSIIMFTLLNNEVKTIIEKTNSISDYKLRKMANLYKIVSEYIRTDLKHNQKNTFYRNKLETLLDNFNVAFNEIQENDIEKEPYYVEQYLQENDNNDIDDDLEKDSYFVDQYLQEKDNNDVTASDIMRKFSCSKEQAIKFMKYVSNTVTKIENNISNIASNSTPKKKRFSIAQDTIETYFESSSSKIYRTSLSSNRVKYTPVTEYFNLLATNYNGKYDEIEIYFKENWIKMGNIEEFYNRKYGKTYEFSIDAWQYFVGRLGDDIVYGDVTLKSFNYIFYKDKNSEFWELKVKAVVAKETLSKKEFEGLWK